MFVDMHRSIVSGMAHRGSRQRYFYGIYATTLDLHRAYSCFRADFSRQDSLQALYSHLRSLCADGNSSNHCDSNLQFVPAERHRQGLHEGGHGQHNVLQLEYCCLYSDCGRCYDLITKGGTMYGEIQIGSKKVGMLSNAASLYVYKNIFHEDFLKKLQEILL